MLALLFLQGIRFHPALCKLLPRFLDELVVQLHKKIPSKEAMEIYERFNGNQKSTKDAIMGSYVYDRLRSIISIHKNRPLGIVKSTQAYKEIMDFIVQIITNIKRSRTIDRIENYTALFGLLEMIAWISEDEVLDIMEEICATTKENTKRERRLALTAKALIAGSILRSNRPMSLEIGDRIVKTLLNPAMSSKSELAVSHTFILIMIRRPDIETIRPTFFEELDQYLIKAKHGNSYGLRIIFTCLNMGKELTAFKLLFPDVKDYGKFVLWLRDDTKGIEEFLYYIKSRDLFAEFWSQFEQFGRRKHMKTFVMCFIGSLNLGCDIKICASQEILLHIFKSVRVSDTEVQKDAQEAVLFFLNLNNFRGKAARKYVLKSVVTMNKELVKIYHIITPSLNNLLSKCTQEELDYLITNIWTLWIEEDGETHGNVYNFLAKIARAKNSSSEQKEIILFRLASTAAGICWKTNEMLTVENTELSRISFRPIITILRNEKGMETLMKVINWLGQQFKGKYKKKSTPNSEPLGLFLRNWNCTLSNQYLDFMAKSYLLSYLILKEERQREKFEILKKTEFEIGSFLPVITEFFLENILTEQFPFKFDTLYLHILSSHAMDEVTINLICDYINKSISDFTDDNWDEEDEFQIAEANSGKAESNNNNVGENEDEEDEEDAQNAMPQYNIDPDGIDVDLDDADNEALLNMDRTLGIAMQMKKQMKKDRKSEASLEGMRKLCAILDQYLSNSEKHEALHIVMLFTPLINFISCRSKPMDFANRTFFRLTKVTEMKNLLLIRYDEIIVPMLEDAKVILEKKLKKDVRVMVNEGVKYLESFKSMLSSLRMKKKQSSRNKYLGKNK